MKHIINILGLTSIRFLVGTEICLCETTYILWGSARRIIVSQWYQTNYGIPTSDVTLMVFIDVVDFCFINFSDHSS